MASFSDPPEPTRRGFVPPQNEAERFLMTRVEELCRTAESRGFPRATGFLSDREQSLAWAAACRAGRGCTRWEGGYPGADHEVGSCHALAEELVDRPLAQVMTSPEEEVSLIYLPRGF